MKIENAKSELENLVIFWEGVIGVGIIQKDGKNLIEIAIDKRNNVSTQKVKDLCFNNMWKDFEVSIVFIERYNKY